MTDRLTPEREAEIADRLAEARRLAAEADWPLEEYQAIRQQQADTSTLLAELAAVRAEVAELEQDAAKLAALEAHGVDSWEGYDEALAGVRAAIAGGAAS